MSRVRGPTAPFRTLADLVEAQVDRSPGALALLDEDETLSYAGLDLRANRLARVLQGAGAGPEVPAAVLFERSTDLVVALLAILKAGGACLPLDPAHPPLRLSQMLADGAPPVLLSTEPLAARLASHPARLILLDRDRAVIEHQDSARPPPRAGPEDLAYVIYTSGSTGEPKGVELQDQVHPDAEDAHEQDRLSEHPGQQGGREPLPACVAAHRHADRGKQVGEHEHEQQWLHHRTGHEPLQVGVEHGQVASDKAPEREPGCPPDASGGSLGWPGSLVPPESLAPPGLLAAPGSIARRQSFAQRHAGQVDEHGLERGLVHRHVAHRNPQRSAAAMTWARAPSALWRCSLTASPWVPATATPSIPTSRRARGARSSSASSVTVALRPGERLRLLGVSRARIRP